MTKTSKTVVFFGSGPVAAESLRLLAENFTIEAVITKPRAQHHKGEVPVLTTAEKLSLPIHTAADKQELNTLFDGTRFHSRVAVLVDFGIIVSQQVIDYFPLGIVNSHFSLLPKWRGADPITFAILHGDTETGVSLMLLVEKMDEGPLLAQAPLQVPSDCTTPELTETLVDCSDRSLAFILPKYIAGEIQPAQQDSKIEATYSRKLTKADGIIDWHKSAEQLEREIRAFVGWPKSRSELAGQEIIITKAVVVDQTGTPGEIKIENNELVIYTKDKALKILSLKPAGKPEMAARAYLAGYGKLL
jgi:methionyl-tRNA formyltransferase